MLAVVDRPSPNHGPRRGGAVDMLILHYTGMESAGSALDRLCDPAAEVSAHYLIAEDGAISRLVAEDRRAWHAGASWWAGEADINSRSIGIELANPGHGPDWRPFAAPQMSALEILALEILARHPIPPHRVLGHSDVAPDRKRDPGEWLDWPRLAQAGIGLWPDAAQADAKPAQPVDAMMRRFGYRDASAAAVMAFQRHFRPARIDGIADPETCARLANLITQAGLA